MLVKIVNALMLVGLIAIGWIYLTHASSAQYKMTNMTIGSTTIEAKIADTETLRELGLSGTRNLPQGQGMLFVFDTPGNYAFWMKDMNYPLDIIWVDASSTVVTVHPDLSPQTYPQSFSSASAALYVIEVPAGFAVAHNIRIGTKIVIH